MFITSKRQAIYHLQETSIIPHLKAIKLEFKITFSFV